MPTTTWNPSMLNCATLCRKATRATSVTTWAKNLTSVHVGCMLGGVSVKIIWFCMHRKMFVS